jgi:molybdopterin molybdotransferase
VDRVRLRGRARPGQHVRRAGEERRPGDLLLAAGSILSPAAIGLLANAGVDRVDVFARPRVVVIATGDELVEPGQPLGPGQIHASNTAALCAWIEQAGAVAIDGGVARDTLADTLATFQRALDRGPDLLISTGGVSVGDFDVVKEAFGHLGVHLDFWKVRVKPGKPLAFGRIGPVPIFGLPGNPVSCQVNFLQFVRPLLRRALGDQRPYLPVLPVQVQDDFRKEPGRAELVRLSLHLGDQGIEGRTTGDQGSGQSSSMAWAHGLALLAESSTGFSAGQLVPTQIFDWSFTRRAADPTPWLPG